MDRSQFRLLHELLKETRDDVKQVSGELTKLKLEIAESKGEKKVWGSIGTWVNTLAIALISAWFGLSGK